MYRIIDNRGTGKTSRLLLLAKEHDGIVVCANPNFMKEKAYRYGLTGIEFMSYLEFIKTIEEQAIDVPMHLEDGSIKIIPQNIIAAFSNKPIFIDEIDCFFNKLSLNMIKGYTLSSED